MSDLKALTSEKGKYHIGGLDDDRSVPESPSKNAFFSSWMRRLGGANRRRGSVGFTDQGDQGDPPNRFDDESNSGHGSPRDGWALSFSRKRNESYSELTGLTPGEDCDTYFYKNKFNRTDSEANMRDAVQSSVSATTDGMLKMDGPRETVTPNPNLASLGLQTLEEGKMLDTRTAGSSEKSSPRKHETDPGSSIFLIDFEEIESDTGKKILKPTGRKFSASLLQSKFAQSWFFKNAEAGDDGDSLVEAEPKQKQKESKGERRKISEASEDYEENGKEDKKPLLSRIKSAVEKNSSKHREMNLWQPQGT